MKKTALFFLTIFGLGFVSSLHADMTVPYPVEIHSKDISTDVSPEFFSPLSTPKQTEKIVRAIIPTLPKVVNPKTVRPVKKASKKSGSELDYLNAVRYMMRSA